VTDEELAEEVKATSDMYQDSENFEAHWQHIKRFKEDFKLDNYDVYDKIVNARGRAPSHRSTIDDFFYELRRMVM
jgi:hypothetical protein